MTGHEKLLADLRELLAEAEAFEFHDFRNRKYATPKATLASKLFTLRHNVMNGKYDEAEGDS